MPGFDPPLSLDDFRALAEVMALNKEVTLEQSMRMCKVKFPTQKVGGLSIAKGGHVATMWYNKGKKENITVISPPLNEDVLLSECETMVKFCAQCLEQGTHLEPPEGKAWVNLAHIWRVPAYYDWDPNDALSAGSTATPDTMKAPVMKAPPPPRTPLAGAGPPPSPAPYKAPPTPDEGKPKGPPPKTGEYQYPVGLAAAAAAATAGPVPLPQTPGELLQEPVPQWAAMNEDVRALMKQVIEMQPSQTMLYLQKIEELKTGLKSHLLPDFPTECELLLSVIYM